MNWSPWSFLCRVRPIPLGVASIQITYCCMRLMGPSIWTPWLWVLRYAPWPKEARDAGGACYRHRLSLNWIACRSLPLICLGNHRYKNGY
jgi:hypothetical protein